MMKQTVVGGAIVGLLVIIMGLLEVTTMCLSGAFIFMKMDTPQEKIVNGWLLIAVVALRMFMIRMSI